MKHPSETHVGTGTSADMIEQRVRSLYGRTLASWAQDALRLRARGLDMPCERSGSRGAPFGPLGQCTAASAARWRIGRDIDLPRLAIPTFVKRRAA